MTYMPVETSKVDHQASTRAHAAADSICWAVDWGQIHVRANCMHVFNDFFKYFRSEQTTDKQICWTRLGLKPLQQDDFDLTST